MLLLLVELLQLVVGLDEVSLLAAATSITILFINIIFASCCRCREEV